MQYGLTEKQIRRGLFRSPPRVKRAIGAGNNPMVGATVAVAFAVEEASK